MIRKTHFLPLILALGALLALSACSSSTEPQPTSFEGVINAGGTYEKVEPSQDIELVSSEEEELPDGSITLCTVEHHSIIDAPNDYMTFDPNAEVVFPGNLLQGQSLGQATPDPIVVDRAPGTITINLINGSQSVSADVDEVRYSTVIQAMNDIIAENNGTLPAAFTYRSSEVQSREQMALNMGVNVETMTTDVRSSLSINTDIAYSSFLVELNQRYYTMSYDMPASREAIFASTVEPADLARFIAPANPATYISSVTYGRRFYLLVESTESAADMRASIQASYDAALAGGSGHLNGRDVSSLSNVNVKVFALGGDASLALAAFNGNVDAVAEFLTDGGNIDTGVPLSYTVRNVKDNTLVNVKVATDFDVKNCVVQQVGSFAADFESGVEGWTGYADFQTFGTRSSSASIDGDYLYIKDRGQGGTCYFRAPLAYGGDWSHFYGGEISFYMFIGGPGDYFARDDVVLYDVSGNRLAMRFSGSPSSNGFFRRSATLDESTAWLFNGATATAEQIQLVESWVAQGAPRGASPGASPPPAVGD